MGQVLYRALSSNDQPVIMGVALVVGVAVVLANMTADLVYCWVDPRVRPRAGGWARTPVLRRGRARAQAGVRVSPG
jgi:hypothetical protein